jgi:hypothetical protein
LVLLRLLAFAMPLCAARIAAQEGWAMSDFPSEISEMLSREASVLVRRVAEPRTIGDSVKAAIVRASRRLGWRFSRTRDIWYAHARRIDAFEIDALRAAAAEAQMAAKRLLALRDALIAKDPAFHCDDIRALERALRGMGCDVVAGSIRGIEEAAERGE